jgi:hypothetical protein
MALTDEDKEFIKTLLEDVLEYKLEEKIKEHVGNLPTKEEFNSRMDEMMGELKTTREEQAGLSQHDRDQFDAIEALQKIHPRNSHSTFA